MLLAIIENKVKVNSFVAEFIGTFFLVLFGTGSIVISEVYNLYLSNLIISAVFGLTVTLMIILFIRNSGAHINPAVSFGLYLAGKLSCKRLILFTIAQISGAIFASFLIGLAFPENANLGDTLPSIPIVFTFIIEVVITLILMYVIIDLASNELVTEKTLASVVGLTVGLAAFVAGPLTGASMNPARSIGPAIVSGNLNFLWIYILAPMLGATFAIILCSYIKKDACCSGTCISSKSFKSID